MKRSLSAAVSCHCCSLVGYLLIWMPVVGLAGCQNTRTHLPVVQSPAPSQSSSPPTQTEKADVPVEPTTDAVLPIEQLVERDAHTAHNILTSGLHSEDDSLAAWSAVYIRLLKVKSKPAATVAALNKGLHNNDSLLQLLCYRWMVFEGNPVPQPAPDDPLFQLFSALGQWRHGQTDAGVLDALAEGSPGAQSSNHTPKSTTDTAGDDLNALIARTAPFDNGAVALAIAFVTARRNKTTATIDGVTVWASAAYRLQLLQLLQLPPLPIRKTPAPDFSMQRTSIVAELENALSTQSLETVRIAAASADGTLQRDALRALAILAVSPEIGDFAAAAAALQSPSEQIQIEAARTYLLLVARATGGPQNESFF